MAETADFLVEIGTEELPPKALASLSDAFRDGLGRGLEEARLTHRGLEAYASPRRLAVKAHALSLRQPDREIAIKGPPLRVAVLADGSHSPAALKFAEASGVPVASLVAESTAKGDYLFARRSEAGRPAAELLPGLVEAALGALPVPRRMRWGELEAEFVRPVHWLVMLLDGEVVPCRLFGVESGRATRGHRFHAPRPLELAGPDDYPARLESEGRVIADFGRRRERIRRLAMGEAEACGGHLVLDDALLDEVTALVEWPVVLSGAFDARFLELPPEVLVATLQDHQRYFPLRDATGELLPRFVAVSNLESRDPEVVRRGNERVVVPRLSDAAFFYARDRQSSLADRCAALSGVVFQKRLGSLADKSERITALAVGIAECGVGEARLAKRAAALAKCDLLTAMVGEFPELQGTMGRYYAAHDHEPEEVAVALQEQYLPRFAGDSLPATGTGRCLALADRLDTVAGIFAIGQRPTGNRDPFGIRRAALGVLRILIEGGIDLDLAALIERALALQPVPAAPGLDREVYDYFMDRLKGYYLDGNADIRPGPDAFEAVLARRPASPLDFHQRLAAVLEFSTLDAAEALAAANKRIANILRQADGTADAVPDPARLTEAAERELFRQVEALAREVGPLVGERRYRDALERLATLRAPVDRFFDEVLVMDPDAARRDNRLALLSRLRSLFLGVADVSRLGA